MEEIRLSQSPCDIVQCSEIVRHIYNVGPSNDISHHSFPIPYHISVQNRVWMVLVFITSAYLLSITTMLCLRFQQISMSTRFLWQHDLRPLLHKHRLFLNIDQEGVLIMYPANTPLPGFWFHCFHGNLGITIMWTLWENHLTPDLWTEMQIALFHTYSIKVNYNNKHI